MESSVTEWEIRVPALGRRHGLRFISYRYPSRESLSSGNDVYTFYRARYIYEIFFPPFFSPPPFFFRPMDNFIRDNEFNPGGSGSGRPAPFPTIDPAFRAKKKEGEKKRY